MRRLLRALIVLVTVGVVLGGSVVLIEVSNGDFSGAYGLSGTFPRAGQGLEPGAAVVYRGVQVGRVSSISLTGTRAKVGVLIQPNFRVPADTTATIEPVNLFGAEQISLTDPSGDPGPGTPALAPGSEFPRTAVSDELGAFFGAAAPLFKHINGQDLGTVVSELAQGTAGDGPQIASSINEGARLASLLDSTLQAQLTFLDANAAFAGALAPTAGTFNALSADENVLLPVFNRDQASYQTFLETLSRFSDHLAALVTEYHPDIARMLADGDNVARLLTAQQEDIATLLQGAFHYVYKLGEGGSAGTLPDGSRFAYFNVFLLFSDVNNLVCNLLAPSAPGLSMLEPLQQALAGAGTPFDCSAQLASFEAAQGPKAPTAPTGALPVAVPAAAPSAPSADPTAAAKAALQQLTNQVYANLAQPSSGPAPSLGGYIQSLTGGAL